MRAGMRAYNKISCMVATSVAVGCAAQQDPSNEPSVARPSWTCQHICNHLVLQLPAAAAMLQQTPGAPNHLSPQGVPYARRHRHHGDGCGEGHRESAEVLR